jgi:hypothetical protein
MSSAAQATLELPDLPGIGHGWELLLPRAELARRCTADVAVRCEEQRIEILKACVRLGTRSVAEAFGISREVVRRLRADAIRSGELDHFKEELGRRFLAAADQLVDRIEDEPDKIPVASLPLSAAILVDKGLLLTGAPTARIQVDHRLSVAGIADYIDSLPSVEPVEVGENSAQKALEAAPGDAPGADIPRGMLGDAQLVQDPALAAAAARDGDSQSLVSAQVPEVSPADGAKDGQIEPKREGQP